jgi:NAD-dependent dihydropyrimidine dehydrogenase PreA subunit
LNGIKYASVSEEKKKYLREQVFEKDWANWIESINNKKALSEFPKYRAIPHCSDNEYREVAWGIERFGESFKPLWINRPKCGDKDVRFEMKYCGICHSDCHIGNNDLDDSMYPMVPGHELIGTVVEVGSKVKKVKVGDNVGVGVIKDSCLKCGTCVSGDEQYCESGFVHTYNSMKKHPHVGGNQDT